MDNNRNRRNMRRYNNSCGMNMRQPQNQRTNGMNGYMETNAANLSSDSDACPCHTAPNMVLAMAYVPWQHFDDTFEPAKALMTGTIFPELDKPFLGGRGCGCR